MAKDTDERVATALESIARSLDTLRLALLDQKVEKQPGLLGSIEDSLGTIARRTK